MSRRSPGTGSIRSRGRDRHVLTVTTGTKPDGTQDRRSETFYGTRTEARKYLDALCEQYANSPAARAGMTFKQFAEDKYLPYIKRKRQPKTYDGYKHKLTLHIYPRLGDEPLASLKPYHFEEMLDALEDDGMTPQSLVHVRRISMQVMNYASDKGFIETWNSRRVAAPVVKKKKPDTLSVKEAKDYIKAFAGHEVEMALAFGLCGLRVSEMCGVRHEDIDLEHGVVNVQRKVVRTKGEHWVGPTKTEGSTAPVPLTRYAITAYKRHRGFGYVLQQSDGEPFVADQLRARYKKHVEDCGLRYVTLQNLRHSTATLALKHKGKRTTTMRAVADQLRHSTQTTTETFYYDGKSTVDRSVADVLDDILGS